MARPQMIHVAAPAAWVLAPAGAWRAEHHDRRPHDDAPWPEPAEGWPGFRQELITVLRQARARASRMSDCLVSVPVPGTVPSSSVRLMKRWLARTSAPTWQVESGGVEQGQRLAEAMFRSGLQSVPVLSAQTLQMVTYQHAPDRSLLPPLTDELLAQWQADHIWWATPAGRAWRMLNPRHGAITRTLLDCLDSRANLDGEGGRASRATSLTPA